MSYWVVVEFLFLVVRYYGELVGAVEFFWVVLGCSGSLWDFWMMLGVVSLCEVFMGDSESLRDFLGDKW